MTKVREPICGPSGRDRTVLFSSHLLREFEHVFDIITIIADGKLVATSDNDLLRSRNSVTTIENRICHPGQSATISNAAGSSTLALSFLGDGLSAATDYFSVLMTVPGFRTKACRESPCFLPNWIDSHRAC